jgi:predicted dienelactone hydrolase
MKLSRTLSLHFACILLAFPTIGTAFAGSPPVQELTYDWTDATRERVVPVKIYLPAGDKPLPVIVFSHGLGGSRDGYAYLGKYWAEHGYVAVHPQHAGSDSGVWKDGALGERIPDLKKAILDPRNAIARPLDITFTLDELTKLDGDPKSPLHHRLDLKHIGVAGHSFGAFTSLAVAGMTFTKAGKQLNDPRVSAFVEMSAPNLQPGADPKAAYGTIHIPGLHITGTEDKIEINAGDPASNRRIPYDSIPSGSDQYLVIFDGADHMVFSGTRWRGAPRASDTPVQNDVCRLTTAFWDAYLKGDAAARAGLQQETLKKALTSPGTVEEKK